MRRAVWCYIRCWWRWGKRRGFCGCVRWRSVCSDMCIDRQDVCVVDEKGMCLGFWCAYLLCVYSYVCALRYSERVCRYPSGASHLCMAGECVFSGLGKVYLEIIPWCACVRRLSALHGEGVRVCARGVYPGVCGGAGCSVTVWCNAAKGAAAEPQNSEKACPACRVAVQQHGAHAAPVANKMSPVTHTRARARTHISCPVFNRIPPICSFLLVILKRWRIYK